MPLRYANIGRCEEASVIGIVAGTLGVARYRAMVSAIRQFVRSRGRHSYTFIVGKVNVEKLGNFPEVQLYGASLAH